MSGKVKKPIWKRWWAWVVVATFVIAIATNDSEPVVETAQTQQTATTNESDSKNRAAIEEWTKLSFVDFSNKFNALDPAKQSEAVDLGLVGAQVTWEGIAIDDQRFIREDKYTPGISWSSMEPELMAYVVRIYQNDKDFKPGDKVSFTGKIKSRGQFNKAANSYADWQLQK